MTNSKTTSVGTVILDYLLIICFLFPNIEFFKWVFSFTSPIYLIGNIIAIIMEIIIIVVPVGLSTITNKEEIEKNYKLFGDNKKNKIKNIFYTGLAYARNVLIIFLAIKNNELFIAQVTFLSSIILNTPVLEKIKRIYNSIIEEIEVKNE